MPFKPFFDLRINDEKICIGKSACHDEHDSFCLGKSRSKNHLLYF
ncbi:hypothetical protein [Moraxella lacunata]